MLFHVPADVPAHGKIVVKTLGDEDDIPLGCWFMDGSPAKYKGTREISLVRDRGWSGSITGSDEIRSEYRRLQRTANKHSRRLRRISEVIPF